MLCMNVNIVILLSMDVDGWWGDVLKWKIAWSGRRYPMAWKSQLIGWRHDLACGIHV